MSYQKLLILLLLLQAIPIQSSKPKQQQSLTSIIVYSFAQSEVYSAARTPALHDLSTSQNATPIYEKLATKAKQVLHTVERVLSKQPQEYKKS